MARYDAGNAVPDDWDGEQTMLMTMCVPKSVGWRVLVTGAMARLANARYYTWSEGKALEAKQVAERMLRTMTFDCNNDFGRMADALEAINTKIPSLITLEEFLEDIQNSPILSKLADWIDLATIAGSILPNLDLQLTPIEWVRFIFEFRWKRNIANSADSIADSLRLLMLAQTGETVAEGAETIDGYLDDISDWAAILVQGGTLAAEAAQAYAQMRDLYAAEGANVDLDLRNFNRVQNSVFVDNEVDVNLTGCCGGDGDVSGSVQTISPGAGGVGGGPFADPDEYSGDPPLDQDKCNRTTHIVEKYIEYIANGASMSGIIGWGMPAGFAVWLQTTPVVFTTLMTAGALPLLFGYMAGVAAVLPALSSYLATFRDNLTATKNVIICDILDLGTSPSAIRTLLAAWMSSNLPGSLPELLVDKHVDAMFSNNVCNWIFDGEGYYPDLEVASCAFCTEWVPFQLQAGTLIDGNLTSEYFKIESELVTSGVFTIRIRIPENCYATILFDRGTSQSLVLYSGMTYYWWDELEEVIGTSTTWPGDGPIEAGQPGGHQIFYYTGTAETCEFFISNPVTP